MHNEGFGNTLIESVSGCTYIYDGEFYTDFDPIVYKGGQLAIHGGEFTTEYGSTGENPNKHGFIIKNEKSDINDFTMFNCKLNCNTKTMSYYAGMAIYDRDGSPSATDVFTKHIAGNSKLVSGQKADTNTIIGHSIVIKNTEKYGDANGDSKVDIEDAVTVISHINGLKPLSPTGSYMADIDDNETVDIEDAVAVIGQVNGDKPLV